MKQLYSNCIRLNWVIKLIEAFEAKLIDICSHCLLASWIYCFLSLEIHFKTLWFLAYSQVHAGTLTTIRIFYLEEFLYSKVVCLGKCNLHCVQNFQHAAQILHDHCLRAHQSIPNSTIQCIKLSLSVKKINVSAALVPY